MMYFKYDLDEIKNQLEKYREFYTAAAAAWEGVTVRKTKTGAEFKNLGAALDGCRLGDYIGLGRELTVYFRTERGGYESDELRIYGYLDELPATDPRRADYVRQTFRQKYELTPDEIRAKIADHITFCRQRAADYAEQIERAEDLYIGFRSAVDAAVLHLKTVTKGREDHLQQTVFHLITDCR